MKLLTLSALLCAMIALASAADAAEPEAVPEKANEDPAVVKRACFWGWTKIGCRHFYYVKKLLTWHQAERNCRSQGGHLASVHSAWEYQRIRALVARNNCHQPHVWIGGTDEQWEGHWKWSDNTHFKYKNWCCGEPNNAGNQDCLQMNFSAHKCWDDAQCWIRLPSVCVRTNRW